MVLLIDYLMLVLIWFDVDMIGWIDVWVDVCANMTNTIDIMGMFKLML